MSRRTKANIRAAVPPASQSECEELFTIGELAAELDLTTRAIRFYEQKGLIQPARKGSARAYSRRDRARMRLILQGKNLGFSLADIAEYLSLYDSDPGQVAQTRLLDEKVAAAIAELEKKRTDIDRALRDLAAIRDQCRRHLEARGQG